MMNDAPRDVCNTRNHTDHELESGVSLCRKKHARTGGEDEEKDDKMQNVCFHVITIWPLALPPARGEASQQKKLCALRYALIHV